MALQRDAEHLAHVQRQRVLGNGPGLALRERGPLLVVYHVDPAAAPPHDDHPDVVARRDERPRQAARLVA